MIRKLLCTLVLGCLFPWTLSAQINTDKVMTIGKNALYFEDYVLSIQYFNQVVNAKPELARPYLYRAIAKFNLDDFRGALAADDRGRMHRALEEGVAAKSRFGRGIS